MKRSRRWVIAASAAGVLVLLAVGWGVWQASHRTPTAEETTIGYLRALESGDSDALTADGLVPVSEEAIAAFEAVGERVTDPVVVRVQEVGDEASADVSFSLAGDEHSARLTLTMRDGRWAIDESGLGTMAASTSVGTFVGVGGQTLPADEDALLLPAVYEVSAAPSAVLDGASSATVLPGQRVDVAVEASLRPEAEEAAQEKLKAHLQACTAPSEEPPSGCGIRVPWGVEFRAVDEFRFRIEQAPTIALTADGFRAADGVLVATVRGTGQDGGERTTTYRTTAWTIRGDVSFTADELVLEPW